MFADLYRFGKAGEKNQLEDFTTEALKAVLNAAPTTIIEQIVSWVLEACHVPASNISSVKEWEWRTQIGLAQAQIEGLSGFIDIALYADNEPFMVFENKVGADFQPKQLERYGQWLSESMTSKHLPRCLCVINHGSTVPEEFTDPNNREYHIANRAVFSWADWLRKLEEINRKKGDIFDFLLQGLREFLEEHDMATDYPDDLNIAQLYSYIPNNKKIIALIDEMWEYSKGELGKRSSNQSYLSLDSDNGCIWKWANCTIKYGVAAYFAVGIRFPELSQTWRDKELNNLPKVFLILGDDNNGIRGNHLPPPSSAWRLQETDWIVEKDLATFEGGPDERARAIFDWIESRSKELAVLCDQIQGDSA